MNTRLLVRAATPARALRAVGAPSSFRVVAVPAPHAGPSHSAQSTLAASSSRAFSTSAPALKKGSKAAKKGGKRGQDAEEDEFEGDEPPTKTKAKAKSKDKGGKKGKKGKEDVEEDKGLTPEEIDAVADKTKAKMDKTVDWARGVVYDGVQRGRGHVSPGEWAWPRPFSRSEPRDAAVQEMGTPRRPAAYWVAAPSSASG